MTEPLCLTCQHHNKDCPMDDYPKTCVEHKPETVADLHEEMSDLRKERDQLRADLAAERERADRAEHRLGLFKAEAEAAHKEKNEKHLAMNDARAELAEVKRDRESLWKCNAGLRTAWDERDAARAEAALSKQETHAVEHMLVRRLGGTVEGAPTSAVNYLQRVDELREIERVSDALRARVAVLEGLLREVLDHNNGRLIRRRRTTPLEDRINAALAGGEVKS